MLPCSQSGTKGEFLSEVRAQAEGLTDHERQAAFGVATDVVGECIPSDLATAARELIDFVRGRRPRPDWMRASKNSGDS